MVYFIEEIKEKDMTKDVEIAKALLTEKNCRCAAVKGGDVMMSYSRGIAPLLALKECGADMTGYSAADTVVGKAAALLYVGLGIKELYAQVISERAVAVLKEAGIEVSFSVSCKAIVNRKKDGVCPMDRAVAETDDPLNAYAALKAAAAHLPKGEWVRTSVC